MIILKNFVKQESAIDRCSLPLKRVLVKKSMVLTQMAHLIISVRGIYRLMNPETIAQQARKSISSYCINECKAYCCRKGFLVFSSKESSIIPDLQKQQLIAQQRPTPSK